LCNLLGGDIESGLIPDSDYLVGPLIRNICYYNAERYLGLLSQ
jgi:glucuronate isomerase